MNGELITKTEQEDMIKAATARGQQRTEELENQVKQLLTQQSVLVQEAKKQHLDRKSDVRRAIERARESILMQALVEDYLKKNPVPESDVRALFDAEKKRWGDTEVQVRHILVKDQATAEKLLKDLKGGADFAKLAKEQSVDTQICRRQIVDEHHPADEQQHLIHELSTHIDDHIDKGIPCPHFSYVPSFSSVARCIRCIRVHRDPVRYSLLEYHLIAVLSTIYLYFSLPRPEAPFSAGQ